MKKVKILIVVWLLILIAELIWYSSVVGLNADSMYFEIIRSQCAELHEENETKVDACVNARYLSKVKNNDDIHNWASFVIYLLSPAILVYLGLKEHNLSKKNKI